MLYRLVSSDYASRVPDDAGSVLVHEGVSWTFLTLADPAGPGRAVGHPRLGGPGGDAALARLAVPAPVAAWGGLAALLLACSRAVAFDRYWSADIVPVWNLTFLVHLLVAGALAVGGWLGGRAAGGGVGSGQARGLLRAALWVASVVTLAVLFWREPTGLVAGHAG